MKSIKTVAKINLISSLIFLFSLIAWIGLTTDYFKINDQVQVLGVQQKQVKKDILRQIGRRNEAQAKNLLQNTIKIDQESTEVIEKQLALKKKAAPKRKENVGSIYLPAHAAAVLDVDSEKFLYRQKAEKHLPIASLTKLMTALVVIDNLPDVKREVVTIDQETCQVPTTIIGCPTSTYCFSDTLKVGEKVKAKDLLEAMLVNSANDAAVALAKQVAGSQEKFTELMNKKAREIGLRDSHFCNPSGLDPDDEAEIKKCYSSAADVAKLVVYALKNKRYQSLWPIFKIKEKWFYSVDGKYKHRYATTNILLDSMSNCEGAKTGFTYEAGKTLMMIAHHPRYPEKKVVGVLLNDPYRFEDIQKLFNWVFASHTWPVDQD